ncbi:hypothetical protein ACFQU9_13580 [Actinomadura namibiensis]|uniref:Uncharacterized protein n=1 Tax=Actinomadura namibiensis TaxID=182080 RepID=A0A7W3QRI4_ACTNM|nr:hypothetical protein [Actinomadura namibiensis]MBA8956789.1 hypothetical protein [Actinomadura namibiensis]
MAQHPVGVGLVQPRFQPAGQPGLAAPPAGPLARAFALFMGEGERQVPGFSGVGVGGKCLFLNPERR